MDTAVLLEELNHRIIRGEEIPSRQQRAAVDAFIGAARQRPGTPSGIATLYYGAPEEDGRLRRLFYGRLPKTRLLAANVHELEILRLLQLWAGDDRQTKEMREASLDRLSRVCFGRFCSTGECTGASIATLRFYTAADPSNPRIGTICRGLRELMVNAGDGMASEKNGVPVYYLYLALTGLENPDARAMLEDKKSFFTKMLTRGCLASSSAQDAYNETILYILKNALSTLPGFEYVRTRRIYTREDNRLYCDL